MPAVDGLAAFAVRNQKTAAWREHCAYLLRKALFIGKMRIGAVNDRRIETRFLHVEQVGGQRLQARVTVLLLCLRDHIRRQVHAEHRRGIA